MSWSGYNANSWTSADLVSDIRRRARLSNDDLDYTDAVLMREATDQIWSVAARVEAEAKNGRAVLDTTRTVTTDAVSTDGADYVLPPMCAAGAISSIFWVDAQGNMTKLSATTPDREAEWSGSSGTPVAYALFAHTLRLYPDPDTTGTLRVIYQRRHPALVAVSEVRALASFASASGGTATQLTLASNAPSGMTAGAWVDVVGAAVPHAVRYADAVVTAASGTNVTVSVPFAVMSAAIDSTAARNYVQLSGQSYFIQLPLEMRSAVASLAAASIMNQMGDIGGAQRTEMGAMRELADISGFLASRTRGTKETIINRSSLMRSHIRNNW